MNQERSNEKIIQLLAENLYGISNSLTVILDSLFEFMEKDLSELEMKKMTLVVLIELEQVVPALEKLNKEMPIKDAKDSSDELILMYHTAMSQILTGFNLLLEFIRDEKYPKDVLSVAIDSLFDGAQTTVDLVDKIL